MTLERLRTPLLLIALALVLLALLLELGAPSLLARLPAPTTESWQAVTAGRPELRELLSPADVDRPPGLGIRYLALFDALLLLSLTLIALPLLLPERILGRLLGVITLIASLLLVLIGIVLALLALLTLMLMVSLFLAAPFGTIAYLAIYGFFARGAAAAALGSLTTLKVAAAVCLLLAHQRFLQNRGLIMLFLGSLLCTLIVGFLHALVPLPLVSITDALGALVVAVIAVVWAVVVLIGSLVAVSKSLKPTV